MEYNKPLVLVPVVYENAIYIINQQEMLKCLIDCCIDHRYITIIEHIYENSTTNNFYIEKGVRQGDNISPKLFNMLQYMCKHIKWC